MAEQIWFCDTCKKRGSVEIEERAGVMTVIHLIEDAHINISSRCKAPVSELRAVNSAMISAEELAEVMALPTI